MLDYDSIFKRVKEALAPSAPAPIPVADPKPVSGDTVPANLDTVLAATEKLLAVNRGMAEPDDRDSLEFRRVMTPDKLFGERVEMDAGKLRRILMRRLAKAKTLKPLSVGHFDPYAEGLIVGHSLSEPLSEINPLELIERSRRITAMGPGGIPDDDSIIDDMRAVHPSQFGFISPFEGPESGRAGIDVRLTHGARIGSDGRIYQQLHDRREDKTKWLSPSDLVHKTVGLAD